MSATNLPVGWKIVKFAEIATSITERVDDPSAAGVDRYVGLEHLDPESTTISRWGSPSDVESTKLRFYRGDVVYGRRRAYQRKLGVADFDGICSAHALVLRAKPSVCLPEFLPYFLQSDAFHQRALDISVGSLSPTINWKTLTVQEFALPPIDAQRGISAILRSVDSALRATEGAITVSELLARSLRKQLGDQARVRLDVIADVIDCEHKKAPISEGDAYLVGTPDLKDGELAVDPSRRVDAATFEEWTRRGIPVPGDVLLARQAPIGEVAMVPEQPPVCLGQQMVLIKPRSASLSGRLIYHYLRSDNAKEEIRMRSGGSAHPHLNMRDIRALSVPTSSELAVAIVEQLDSCRRTELAMRQLHRDTREIRSALLRRLFGVQ